MTDSIQEEYYGLGQVHDVVSRAERAAAMIKHASQEVLHEELKQRL